MTLSIKGNYKSRTRIQVPKWLQRIIRVKEIAGPWKNEPFEWLTDTSALMHIVKGYPITVEDIKTANGVLVTITVAGLPVFNRELRVPEVSKFSLEPLKGVIVEGTVSLL